jgi:hypothetical protein
MSKIRIRIAHRGSVLETKHHGCINVFAVLLGQIYLYDEKEAVEIMS